jgi:hypothetical protein
MFVLVSPLHVWMVVRLLDLRLARYLPIFIAPLAASAAMAALLFVLRHWGPFAALPLISRVVAEVVVGMAAYALLVAILAPDRTRSLMSQLRRSEASP